VRCAAGGQMLREKWQARWNVEKKGVRCANVRRKCVAQNRKTNRRQTSGSTQKVRKP